MRWRENGEVVPLPGQPGSTLDLDVGTRFSLYPLDRVTGHSEGLRWPIDGVPFAPTGPTGTSNETLGPVRVQVDAPAMLLILPVACQNALIAGLETADGSWPARA